MSRIGKQPVIIPAGVTATVKNRTVTVKGPKGELTLDFKPDMVSIRANDKDVVVSPKSKSQLAGALWGTYRSHIANMVEGVTSGFEKTLILEGVGYRVALKGKDLEFALGFSHPVAVQAPEGIVFAVEKNELKVSGFSKSLVGNTAATIRALKKPEPYKGKGIHYAGEVVRRKAGKKAAGA